LFRIFYDNNQRVYASAIELPKEVALVPIRLTLNLRNTRRIHELVRQHYTGHEIEALGPEGVEVRWIKVNTPEELALRISDCISRLVSLEHVPPDHIAVLVSTEKTIKGIAPSNRLGKFHTARCDERCEGRIVVETIRRFKGLERPIVVISATSDTVIDRELPYVALSRARTHLVVVGTEKVLNRMRGMPAATVEESAINHKK
jgi:DNA helicase IV